ncbi:MAG: hypothetical protein OXB86_07135 [Bdellovibrionales bacterium]|nr:hypothetical protein [Bdellovibrionales bacterium]
MKKILILATELLGYIAVAFIVGSWLDSRFALEGKGTLALVIFMYAIWFFHLYKLYR